MHFKLLHMYCLCMCFQMFETSFFISENMQIFFTASGSLVLRYPVLYLKIARMFLAKPRFTRSQNSFVKKFRWTQCVTILKASYFLIIPRKTHHQLMVIYHRFLQIKAMFNYILNKFMINSIN